MKLYLVILQLTLLTCISHGREESGSAVVKIKQGKLQGLTLESRKGRTYYGFLGIPYAKAPIRFGLAQPPVSWEGTRMATELAPHCFQFCMIEQKLVGVEDCLTLNIYSPKLDSSAKLPVMVYIHSGGFQFGSGNFFHGKYFADEDVVLVTIQYRLGALGFLNTEDDVVPGNNGLKDQNAALKWVQENIKNFGGDPTKVNIFGQSAGGASVHYHILSPLSKGLFTTAISQSGSALNPWAQQPKPKELAMRLAEKLGCNTHDESTEEMVKCLRSKTPQEILTAQMNFSKFAVEWDFISMLFSPSVEKGQSESKFLSDTPYNLITKGKIASNVPWIIGLTPEEGAFYIAPAIENEERMEEINSNWYKMAPNVLYYERFVSPATQKIISEKVKQFYFGDEKLGEDSLQFGRAFGDRLFTVGISKAIREHAKKAQSVYPYIFSFPSEHSIHQIIFRTKKNYGVGHADDNKYQFNNTLFGTDFDLDSPEGQFSVKFVKLWASFARDGKPSATWSNSWKPFTMSEGKEIQWYVFDENPKMVEKDPFKERTDFWESLPLQEFEEKKGKDEL